MTMNEYSLLADASFPCIQRAGEKIPLPWVESVSDQAAVRGRGRRSTEVLKWMLLVLFADHNLSPLSLAHTFRV